MEASTLIDPRVVEAAATVVPVVAHGPLEHGTFQAMESGRSVTRCRLYRNLECGEHQATHEALKPYQPSGRFRIPFTVWIDPEGKQLFRRDGWRRPDEFLLDIRLAIGKVKGPSVSRAEYTELVKPIAEGRAALAARRYAAAAAKFEEARHPDVAEVRRLADEGLTEIQAAGEAILTGAKLALKSGRTRQARAGLDLVARQFPSLDCGREAVGLVRTLPCPLRTLSLLDIDGERGGRAIHVRGDGFVTVRIVAPAESGGLRERRFESSLNGREWDDLVTLIETHRLFQSQPATGAAALFAELWTGETARRPAGGALHDWLLARAGEASTGKPKHEGPHDPAWRPDGF